MAVRVLVVDDDRVVLDSCRRVLETEDMEVTLVASAREALERTRISDYDLLIVDVKMPDHDGVWLIKEMKRAGQETAILVMSGYPTPETIADAATVGANSFIAKPFTPDELLESVRGILQKE